MLVTEDPLRTLVASDRLRSAIKELHFRRHGKNATELEKAGLNSYVTAAPPTGALIEHHQLELCQATLTKLNAI